jgi:hypothetical protein
MTMTSAVSIRIKAAKVRELAQTSGDPNVRAKLDHLAMQYDRLANQIEHGGAAHSAGSGSRP